MDDQALPGRRQEPMNGDSGDLIALLRASLLNVPRVSDAVLERVETACKFLALLTSFKQGDGGLVACETFNSVANLTAFARHLVVQRALDSTGGKVVKSGDERRFLLAAITVCNQLQCLVEICARRYISDHARWVAVLLILGVKLLCQAVLMLRHRARMFCTVKAQSGKARGSTGPFSAASKLKVIECTTAATAQSHTSSPSTSSSTSQTSSSQFSELPGEHSGPYLQLTSGRLIRSVFGIGKPLNGNNEQANRLNETPSTSRSTSRPNSMRENGLRIAEALRILRPFLHLWAVRSFGEPSWLAWLVALLCDSVSAALISEQSENLDVNERAELQRRLATLWFYVLRPPVFERTVRRLIDLIARALKTVLPFGIGSSAIDSLVQQLDFWQTIYTYCWDA